MEKIKELLGEELFSQVEAKLDGKKIMIDDGNFIPKSRFNQVNEQKKELDKQLTGYKTQLEELSKNNKDNEALVKQIEELQLTNKQASEAYENKIKAIEFDYALDTALNSSKCKNNKALKALLDMNSIKYQDGKLEGLETQINSLKESESYLFEDVTPRDTGGVGNFGRSKSQAITKEQFNNMSYADRMNLFNNNKELYDSLNN